jgi:ATP:corrinoid adenosyltransferase
VPLECLDMSGTADEEHANLYIRGVNEAASGAELDAQEILDVLEVFGEDGVRMYLVGLLEGIEDRTEEEIEEYEMLEASVAFVVRESSISIVEESEDTLQVWIESAPKDLSTEIDLHIVDEEEQILQGGRINVVEFKDAAEASETAPVIVTVEKWKSELTEYEDPEDWPRA